MAARPATKLAQLRVAMRAGHWRLAFSIAARFERLGVQRGAILSAHTAYNYPDFYRQLEKDPEILKAEGRRALVRRYGK